MLLQGGRCKFCGHPLQQSPSGSSSQTNTLNEKSLIFCAKKILNYWGKEQEIQKIVVIFLSS